MKLLVISPAPSIQYAAKMTATARRVGLDPLIYGLKSNHPHGKDYQGTDIVKILTERTDAEYIMGVDAPDVAFLAGKDEIFRAFETFDYPLVISTELDGVTGLEKTQLELDRQCQERGGYFAKLNIGCWIGERGYALHCFNEAERLYKDNPENPAYSYDNHFQWLAMMKAWGGADFDLDIHCKIFQSMNKAATEWVDGRIRNTVTGTFPSVLHYNGDPSRVAFNEMVWRILE